MLLFSHPFAVALLAISLNPLAILAADTCGEITWTKEGNLAAAATQQLVGVTHNPIVRRDTPDPKPGDFVCRFHYATSSDVNYYTCKELCQMFQITVDFFFSINPTLEKDCSNIQAKTEYCVAGFIEPLRSKDGFCGPKHNNATCSGTAAQCCNAETFKCGNSDEDCAPGTCYEGACPGDKFFSTDGKCGHQNGGRKCAGKGGDCCNKGGVCGNGTAFCGPTLCQSGKCNWTTSSRSSTTSTSSKSSTTTSTKPTTTSTKPATTSTKAATTSTQPATTTAKTTTTNKATTSTKK